jgi:hypothetical protein
MLAPRPLRASIRDDPLASEGDEFHSVASPITAMITETVRRCNRKMKKLFADSPLHQVGCIVGRSQKNSANKTVC